MLSTGVHGNDRVKTQRASSSLLGDSFCTAET